MVNVINSLVLSLVLSATPQELVEQLGANSFKEREEAQAELIRLEALPELKQAFEHDDPEIRYRAYQAYETILIFTNDIDISIWFLPKEYRFKETDIAKLFNDKAVKEVDDGNAQAFGNFDDEYWPAPQYDRIATRLWARNWMESGKSKVELIKILSKMTIYSSITAEYTATYQWWPEQDTETPIEDRIEKLRAKELEKRL